MVEGLVTNMPSMTDIYQSKSTSQPIKTEGVHTILLLEPQALVRAAISSLINNFAAYEIIAEAATVAGALTKIDQLQPEIVLFELDLEGPSGLELLHEIKIRELDVKTIALTSLDSEQMLPRALAAGVSGYLLKSDSSKELATCLKQVLDGDRYITPQLAHLKDTLASQIEQSVIPNYDDPLAPLSPREREIFHLLASGLQNAVIAKQLFISPRTVETHRARVVRKLELTSNAELIRFAIKHGLSMV